MRSGLQYNIPSSRWGLGLEHQLSSDRKRRQSCGSWESHSYSNGLSLCCCLCALFQPRFKVSSTFLCAPPQAELSAGPIAVSTFCSLSGCWSLPPNLSSGARALCGSSQNDFRSHIEGSQRLLEDESSIQTRSVSSCCTQWSSSKVL